MTRAPAGGIRASGTRKMLPPLPPSFFHFLPPYKLLKRVATSLASSRCWGRGTQVALLVRRAALPSPGSAARHAKLPSAHLALILSDGHQVCLVEQDVGGHEDGVAEETGGDVFALLAGLLFELQRRMERVRRGRI